MSSHSQDTQQYQIFINRLQREEFRPGALNDIKNLLLLKPPGEAANTLRDVGISKIVECLNLQDKVQFDLTCEVLRLCFEKFNAGDVVRNYTGHIMFLLRHQKSCVRRIAVDEVYKAITTDQALLPLPHYIDVYVAIAQLVSDEDVGVSNEAILITSNLPIEAYPKILDEMKIALEYSASSKCNAYEVIVNISTKIPDLLKLSAEHGYFDSMLSELQTPDVLFQMNILDLLSRLAITPHGIKYLVDKGALGRISALVADLRSNPLANLLAPGFLKFYGSVAHLYPREIFETYPTLAEFLFEMLNSNNDVLLPVALDTLGFIGSTIEGKLSLAAIGSEFTGAVSKVGQLISTGTTELKIRSLTCMASLIGIESDPNAPTTGPVDHRVTLMTREWFRNLSPTPMDKLFGICKNPFPDIRMAAFSLLGAACQHQWGEELVARTPGFIEYLLDRSVDHTKESKEVKFDLIRRLSRSAAFDPNVIQRLMAYAEKGPFYIESNLQVAMEDGDE